MYLAGEGAWRRRVPLEVLLPLGAFGVIPATVVLGAWAAGPFVVAITLFSPIAATLILLQVTLLVWVVGGLRAFAARVVRRRAREGVCPACLYEMAGALVDEAGLCRCPECGAVWDTTVEDAKTVVVRWEKRPIGSGEVFGNEHAADDGRAELVGEFPLVADAEEHGIGGKADFKPPAVGEA